MNAGLLLTRLSLILLLISLSHFPLVSLLHAEGNDQANVSSTWRNTKEAFDVFIRVPSSITAREFCDSIPANREVASDREDVLDYIFRTDRITLIATEMLQGNSYAARAAIRIIKFVEGEREQEVGRFLGCLIRVNPATFLKACYAEREEPHIKEKGFPVGYIHRIMKKKERSFYELGMRMEALRSVEDAELESIRDECLKGLKEKIEELGIEIHSCAVHEERQYDNQKEKITSVFEEMLTMPCPENMKRVLDLISDNWKYNLDNIIPLIFPELESGDTISDPFYLILHEARCGNEYAIDVLFRMGFYVIGLPSMNSCALISNLILEKPQLFIKKMAKHGHYLGSLVSLDDLNHICNYISDWDYPEETDEDVILRRRIDALANLSIPEHKELIDHCISLIAKKIKKTN